MHAPQSQHPTYVLGFHGCDAKSGRKVLIGECEHEPSNNPYDWLGSGSYFWEGSYARAFEFAQASKDGGKGSKVRINTPFVLGALIDLGHCLNLLDSQSLDELAAAYRLMRTAIEVTGAELPTNHGGDDRKLRFLDRAVIEYLHAYRKQQGYQPYDTVRAAFNEGGPLYPGAGFTKRAHIQIAVRNPGSIKGWFLPRSEASTTSP